MSGGRGPSSGGPGSQGARVTAGPKRPHLSAEFLRLTSIESVMPSSHLILCHPFLLLPPIPPSIRVFSSESTLRMRLENFQGDS